ncbi:sulfotransferase [Sulfitobacter sp. HNIBRBA3233]|uniref:sulfotransferase family protein n=1 Tax=Sulfitobacter marinivivus TaxID=3158558 RepID=UPI0032DFB3C2
MASFSRSGETLLQRCLNAHPDIEVVHQIMARDIPEDLEVFDKFTQRKEQHIDIDAPLLKHRNLKPSSVLLLKNAVWVHGHPRRGFTLVRNPFSLIASSYREAPPPDQAKRQRAQQIRWARGIDPKMINMMDGSKTIHGFLALYSRKMLQDRRDGLPFVRYEDFVAEPEPWLRKIVAHLGLPWSDRVMKSHEDYAKGLKGHGGIKLWQPINQGSTNKYKAMSEAVKAHIYGLTHEVLHQYGYTWDGETLGLRAVDGML